MSASQQVVVTGGFDDLKSRDIRFLEEAAKLGDLTVLLTSDAVLKESKPPKFPEIERHYFVQAIRYVHQVELVNSAIHEDSLPDIDGLQPGVWVVEASQDTVAKKEFCESRGIRYHVLPDKGRSGFPPVSPRLTAAAGKKKVVVTGTFDWFHSGHVRFFEEAAGYGDLFVVVGHDANIRLLKGEGRPLFPAEERRYVVGSIRFVHQALISTGYGWMDAEPEIEQIKPDLYLVNEDGDVPEKREYCAKHNLEYVVLKRKPAPGLPKRSSTDLRGS